MKTKAFTLIELLIVVAIIAILAAIAVPNFLEAQVRSKVSRVKSDQRAVAVAAESYYVDNNVYPPNDAGPPGTPSQFRLNRIIVFTTPIAYITSFPQDPFLPGDTASPGASLDAFQYFNYDYRYETGSGVAANEWYNYPEPVSFTSWGFLVRGAAVTRDIPGAIIKSWGPDAGKAMGPPPGLDVGDSGLEWSAFYLTDDNDNNDGQGVNAFYDPTNGTISIGDIGRYVGSVPMPQVTN